MDKQSFYRYVNTYNHYKNNPDSFDKHYCFPIQRNNYNLFEKQKFLDKARVICTDSNINTKFYINKNVTNFIIQQHNFLFKWIQDKPIIFPHNPFCLQIEFESTVAHLFFIEDKNRKMVTISYYRDNLTTFNSTLYEIHGNNFDLQNLHISIDDSDKNINMYRDNYEVDRFNIWQCFMFFYMAVYEKQIFYVENNKNKKEKKQFKSNKINYADYKILRIKKEIYKNFVTENKNQKQKSWHMVMSHLRQLQNGKITTVKAHPRGSKKHGIVLKDYAVQEKGNS